jgi:hypothetical protein
LAKDETKRGAIFLLSLKGDLHVLGCAVGIQAGKHITLKDWVDADTGGV